MVQQMYLVSYDISSDRLRNKIAKMLEGYGERVQYSVFECLLTQPQFAEMYGKLLVLMDAGDDGNIRIYDLCQNCRKKLRFIGTPPEQNSEKDVVVI